MPGTLEAADSFQITIGSKSMKVELESDVTITLDGVTIADGNDAPIKIAENCSPTIIIKGTTNLNFNKGGWVVTTGVIQLEKDASVTVKGRDDTDDKLVISNGNEYFDAGIGSGMGGSCGNITIKNSRLSISIGDGTAAIGTGSVIHNLGDRNVQCGNIVIENSDITASAGNFYSAFPSVIGCGGAYTENTYSIHQPATVRLNILPEREWISSGSPPQRNPRRTTQEHFVKPIPADL